MLKLLDFSPAVVIYVKNSTLQSIKAIVSPARTRPLSEYFMACHKACTWMFSTGTRGG